MTTHKGATYAVYTRYETLTKRVIVKCYGPYTERIARRWREQILQAVDGIEVHVSLMGQNPIFGDVTDR